MLYVVKCSSVMITGVSNADGIKRCGTSQIPDILKRIISNSMLREEKTQKRILLPCATSVMTRNIPDNNS